MHTLSNTLASERPRGAGPYAVCSPQDLSAGDRPRRTAGPPPGAAAGGPFAWSRPISLATVMATLMALSACSGGGAEPPPASDKAKQLDRTTGDGSMAEDTGRDGSVPDQGDPDAAVEVEQRADSWFARNTVAQRVSLPNPAAESWLQAETLSLQLAGYDPGSLLRCQVSEDDAYVAAVNALGGVRWGYAVRELEDHSKPHFQAGLRRYPPAFPTADFTRLGGGVEIVKPDIVGVTESAALFYSRSHGLLLVDLTGTEPKFTCATQIPGNVDQFFFHGGHLVAMTKEHKPTGGESHLIHFKIDGASIGFVETVSLGQVNVLDSRRFNEKLVFYTDLNLEPVPEPAPETTTPPQAGIAADWVVPHRPTALHRSLRVFSLGQTLEEELHDTLVDSTMTEEQLISGQLPKETAIGAKVRESRSFGQQMWASDHYFAVSQAIHVTRFSGFRTRSYSVCTEHHTVPVPYTSCHTEYETRPNPDYTPPDNSGGDRACKGETLSDCLVRVARVSNKTIDVPVRTTCESRVRDKWVCDRREQRTSEYPTFEHDLKTQLFIYEYNPDGFVRLDTKVHQIENPDLANVSEDALVPVLTTSTESYDLAVSGSVQTLRFQNGFLYVISKGQLQVYSLSGSSLVKTATLPVVADTLQTSLFSGTKLFLSDLGYVSQSGEQSVLRVVDLTNPGFPVEQPNTGRLPGGHSSIMASEHGLFTIGTVQRFQGQNVSRIKLGLFDAPYTDETAYLVLGTDLDWASLIGTENHFFSARNQRLALPYLGRNEAMQAVQRVSMSRIQADNIVSEGAVVVPEPVQRVRPTELSGTETFLTFASSSVEWLRPAGDEWQAEPVLEYFQPHALLRQSDDDDYAELQRLGTRCKVMWANAKDINQRDGAALSDEFPCVGGTVTAYADQLIFQQSGVQLNDDGTVRALSDKELETTREALLRRETCLLSLDLVDDLTVAYDAPYEQSDFTCVSPEELQRLTDEANGIVRAQGSP